MKSINILNTEELNKLFIDIKGIAERNNAGFTYDVNTRTFVSSGWCVARKETQNSFHNEGLWSVLRFLIENKLSVVGGWYADGKYYFDAVEIFEDEVSATEAGYRNEQLAIFHLDTLTEKQLPELLPKDLKFSHFTSPIQHCETKNAIGVMTTTEITRLEKAIVSYFKKGTILVNLGGRKTVLDSKLYNTFRKLDNFLGLAYTSSGSYAGLFVCNVLVYADLNFKYRIYGFGTLASGRHFLNAHDNEGGTIILPL